MNNEELFHIVKNKLQEIAKEGLCDCGPGLCFGKACNQHCASVQARNLIYTVKGALEEIEYEAGRKIAASLQKEST